jgi:hypothetical protein
LFGTSGVHPATDSLGRLSQYQTFGKKAKAGKENQANTKIKSKENHGA